MQYKKKSSLNEWDWHFAVNNNQITNVNLILIGWFCSLGIVNWATINMEVQITPHMLISFIFSNSPKVGWLDHMVDQFSDFWGIYTVFPNGCRSLQSHQQTSDLDWTSHLYIAPYSASHFLDIEKLGWFATGTCHLAFPGLVLMCIS